MSLAGKTAELRPMPHNLDAERAVLGSMLLDNTTIPIVIDLLRRENFYNTAHQIIFDAVLRFFERNAAVDLTTLDDELRRAGELEKVGGTSYLASLEQFVLSTSNIQHHARIVYNKYKLRRLIEAAHRISESAISEEDEVEKILDVSEKLIFDISQERAVRDFIRISELVVDAIEEIEHRYRSKREVTGVPSGFAELDQLTSGFQPSDLIVVAGRPSFGKTALGLNISLNVAVKEKKPVGIFSLEMSSQQINHRLLCTLAHVSGHRVRTGYLSSVELKRLSQEVKRLSTAPIYIDDTPGLSILELRAKARRLMAQQPELALIIVDYLQLMRSTGRSENRQQEVAEISRSLKSLALELSIPVIAISQLSRMIEHRRGRDKRPMLSDLRESGAIEQDADVVMFVHRSKSFSEEEEEEEEGIHARKHPGEISEIIIGKQRNGPLGTIKLIFFPDFTMFASPPRNM